MRQQGEGAVQRSRVNLHCRIIHVHAYQRVHPPPTRKLAPSYICDTRFASGLMLSSGMVSNSAAVKNPCVCIYSACRVFAHVGCSAQWYTHVTLHGEAVRLYAHSTNLATLVELTKAPVEPLDLRLVDCVCAICNCEVLIRCCAGSNTHAGTLRTHAIGIVDEISHILLVEAHTYNLSATMFMLFGLQHKTTPLDTCPILLGKSQTPTDPSNASGAVGTSMALFQPKRATFTKALDPKPTFPDLCAAKTVRKGRTTTGHCELAV